MLNPPYTKKLRIQLLALGLSLPGLALAQTPAPAETVVLEKFEVTGSRVKRLDLETPAPVVSYGAQEIEAKGYTNIGDFIQSLPFNTGSANSIYQTTSFTRGAATTNPRGLGSQRFLTLIDGRRPATYALPTGGNRQVFDFNSLPSAAIESVEFLKDGASAIYGADALTGVFNVKLKKNYSGLSTSGYYGNTFGHDTGIAQFSVVGGAAGDKARAMVAFDFKTANSNYLRDYGVKTTDYSLTLGTNKGANLNSAFNWPANISVNSALSRAAGPFAGSTLVVTGGVPTANVTRASFSAVSVLPAENRYNFAQTLQLYPSYDYMSGYAQFEYDLADSIKAFATIAVSNNSTYYAFTPGVISFASEGLSMPANSPYNPFGVALTTLLARTNFGPVRKFYTESTSASFVSGLR